ncbi:hypothetical protein [Sphingomonas sp. CFBP 13720]|uniref:hypothetical protein n=1 Tax=Sphingomonas sp. CFBP 13720 TaxID=2775302 RepID=UPI00177DB122|nr:hypothetical protein [Sphingomonas sp. CFBP 13720]MBD8680073.1 hypothetical protein [Sphingomonas sp. CFBP 13720]
MAFRDNSVLISTASSIDVAANNIANVFDAGAGATAFVIADGNVGDDTFLNFGNDDSIITGKKIFDGNNDGYIQFGGNGVLDVDRTSSKNAGNDQLQLVGSGDDGITEIRYLGTKGGQYVYADSSTRRNLIDQHGEFTVREGTVGDDTIDASAGATLILHDNALGLNLGGDTINGFGADDLLVSTQLLFDSQKNNTVTFGKNLVLDTSGANGPQSSDPVTGPGGQIDMNAPNHVSIVYLGSNDIDGVSYYYYGTAGSDFDPMMG